MKIQAPFLTQCVFFGLMLALLAGCSGGNEFSDLRQFFDEVAAEPVRPVQPLPEFKPYESFKYGAANLRSPFQAPLVIASRAGTPPPGSIRPPTNHVRSYLEEMNLATLQLVGSLELRGQYYGLIKDGEGVVMACRHRIPSYLNLSATLCLQSGSAYAYSDSRRTFCTQYTL